MLSGRMFEGIGFAVRSSSRVSIERASASFCSQPSLQVKFFFQSKEVLFFQKNSIGSLVLVEGFLIFGFLLIVLLLLCRLKQSKHFRNV